MGTTTPNISIYIPAAGETNYDAAFAAGMVNIDQHDHSGGPTKGVPIASSGIADGSITYSKLATNVADNATGIGTAGSAGANQLSMLGILKNLYQLATTAGFIAKNGAAVSALTITGTNNQVTVTSGDGSTGNPQIGLPATIYSNISFDGGTNTLSQYRTNTFTPAFRFGGNSGFNSGTRLGKYWRIGDVVFIAITIVITTKSGNSGVATVESLPFTTANDGFFQVIPMSGKIDNYLDGAGPNLGTYLVGEMDPNSNIIKLNTAGAANRFQLTDTNFANGDEFELSGFYWVS